MKNFLIIDDDDLVHNEIEFCLRKIFPQSTIDNSYNINEAMEYLKNKQYQLITLDGNLTEGHHGREILSIMNSDQVKKTVVYSGEIKFLYECQASNILAFSKNSAFEDVLVEIKKKLF